jgi:hypothetical protein
LLLPDLVWPLIEEMRGREQRLLSEPVSGLTAASLQLRRMRAL